MNSGQRHKYRHHPLSLNIMRPRVLFQMVPPSKLLPARLTRERSDAGVDTLMTRKLLVPGKRFIAVLLVTLVGSFSSMYPNMSLELTIV